MTLKRSLGIAESSQAFLCMIQSVFGCKFRSFFNISNSFFVIHKKISPLYLMYSQRSALKKIRTLRYHYIMSGGRCPVLIVIFYSSGFILFRRKFPFVFRIQHICRSIVALAQWLFSSSCCFVANTETLSKSFNSVPEIISVVGLIYTVSYPFAVQFYLTGRCEIRTLHADK